MQIFENSLSSEKLPSNIETRSGCIMSRTCVNSLKFLPKAPKANSKSSWLESCRSLSKTGVSTVVG